MARKNVPQITASNVENFQKIHDTIYHFPDSMFEQVKRASYYSSFIRCEIEKDYNDKGFYIPDNTTQIHEEDDQVTIYAGNLLLIIAGDKIKRPFNYLFVHVNKDLEV